MGNGNTIRISKFGAVVGFILVVFGIVTVRARVNTPKPPHVTVSNPLPVGWSIRVDPRDHLTTFIAATHAYGANVVVGVEEDQRSVVEIAWGLYRRAKSGTSYADINILNDSYEHVVVKIVDHIDEVPHYQYAHYVRPAQGKRFIALLGDVEPLADHEAFESDLEKVIPHLTIK